jgi:hypothetical protein
MSSSAIARPAAASVATLVLTLAGLASANAAEDVVKATSTARVSNRLELEPHAVAGTAPPGIGQGSGLGGGIRAGVTVLGNGLIPNVDDSVAIGVGVDYARYYGKWALNGYQDTCLAYDTAPGGTPVCTAVTFKGGTYTYLYVPVVLQWNFWLGRRFSLFVEPGANLYHLDDHGWGVVPAGAVGARLRLADRVALTARVGYPAATIGLSFML